MKLHNPDVVGFATLAGDPVDDLHAVPKRYVDLRTAGGIFITDITPTGAGIVGLKEYVSGTIPADYYLSDAVTNTASIRVHFIAEPDAAGASIDATVNGTPVPVNNITPLDPNNPRVYQGFVDLVVDEEQTSQVIRIVSSTGSEYSINLAVLVGGPEIQSLDLGAYPAGQTEVKQGDSVTFSGVVGNDAESVRLLNFGVSGQQVTASLGAEDSGGAGFRSFNGTFTASNRSGDLNIRAIATNLLGTDGDTFTSVDSMVVSQTAPSFGTFTPTYPAGQEAIKGSESADFNLVINNADEVTYAPAAGLSIADPTVYNANKTVTRSGEDIQYSFGTNNISVTATRTANGAVRTQNFALSVANVAPTAEIIIVGSPSSLRSDADGEAYTVELRANQNLLQAPDSLDIPANAGLFAGSWTRVNDSRWRKTLTIRDTDLRGDHQFTNLTITGLAGVQGNSITSGDTYRIAGSLQRDLTVPALAQFVEIGTTVFNVNNLTVSYKGADVLDYYPDKREVQKGFTIVDSNGDFVGNGGTHVWISDSAFAGANTSGTLVLEYEEGEG
jgi:hypothetical protein